MLDKNVDKIRYMKFFLPLYFLHLLVLIIHF
nr:MAG TPA: hypothetical protein [Caudoviricetes sp.]DAT91410.1 MAG TPA: hypothetical protein [Caudoviricetes sp.]